MDYLWTPWRYAYVSTAGKNEGKPDGCIFCKLPKLADEEAKIVYRGKHCFIPNPKGAFRLWQPLGKSVSRGSKLGLTLCSRMQWLDRVFNGLSLPLVASEAGDMVRSRPKSVRLVSRREPSRRDDRGPWLRRSEA